MAIVPTADVETRKKPRSRVLDTGLIRFGDVSVPCVIRNLSETGAALDAASECCPRSIYIDCGSHKKIHSCTVVWRKGARVGVSFS